MARYFGDALSTLTTLLLLGVLAYISFTLGHRRKIALWGGRVGILSALGFLTGIFAAARDSYYLSVQASGNPNAAPGLFAVDSVQSIIGSLVGAMMIICAISCLFVNKQPYRKVMFFVISAMTLVKIIIIETGRAGL